MVYVRNKPPHYDDGSINIEQWLQHLAKQTHITDISLIRNACVLSQLTGEDQPTFCGQSCLEQGMEMADILVELKADQDAIAAALVYPSTQFSDLTHEDINEHLGSNITKLLVGVERMDAVRTLYDSSSPQSQNRTHVDNVRRMLLAMVQDVRVVLIKLAEQITLLRGVQIHSRSKQIRVAKETFDMYAPLANRLGLSELKWELEDLAFRNMDPDNYRNIAKNVGMRRVEREAYVEEIQSLLKKELTQAHLSNFEIQGRAKHIYSIYRKMQRKNVGYEKIYDGIAVRVLVEHEEDCYKVLGIVHGKWPHIAQEFDDYIAQPKPNGYRSIHTAVVGPRGQNIEIQIRTHKMHTESELGVAAHWHYKEGGKQKIGYKNKIAWLRQVLEWQKEVAHHGDVEATLQQEIMEDRVYIFTPSGDIVDLPKDSTPLDFAYHIHSEVGHRCRGAKVNGKIVQLTYSLKTGEQVEILTTSEGAPSRDWINPHLGYLKSSRAKAKVHHWFKIQDYDKNKAEGENLLHKAIQRLNLTQSQLDLDDIANKLNFKNGDDLLASLGCGDIRMSQILNYLPQNEEVKELPPMTKTEPQILPKQISGDITIQGVGSLLTHIAKCCNPLPGEHIIGYITLGRGVTVHRVDCPNILHLEKDYRERLIEVEWGQSTSSNYTVELFIEAYNRPQLLKDITTVLANDKISIVSLRTEGREAPEFSVIHLEIEVNNLSLLTRVLDRLNQIPNVTKASRKNHDHKQ